MAAKTYKKGKLRRHKFRQKKNLVRGFGKPWSDDSVIFRVEFCLIDTETGDETNETINWVECRVFKGKERKHIEQYMQTKKSKLDDEETIESKYVLFYVAHYLAQDDIKPKFNQAFIFPVEKKHPDAGDYPLYKLCWSALLEEHFKDDKRMLINFKNAIYHHEKVGGF